MKVLIWFLISSYGRIKSNYNYRGKGSILKPKMTSNGYLSIGLRKSNVRSWKLVHRLVAEAFIDNPNNYPTINHIDEDKTNNNVNNLEWCSVYYNNMYGSRLDKVKKKLNKKICQYDLNMNLIKKYSSLKEASNKLNISAGNISQCINKNYSQTHGYIFILDSEVM